MFEMMSPDAEPMKRKTPETITVSECCKSSVTACTPDNFSKVDKRDKKSLIMTLQFICNMCGNYCKVEEQDIG